MGGRDLLDLILSSLDQDSAQEIVDIDLAGKSDMADFMVVASGRSSRHVAAVADKLIERLKHEAAVPAKTEGLDAADWVLIDAGDVIVHLFRPEVREYYQIEKMWATQPEALARRA
ncbi:MAG: ribosome silencing factor [Pseudomonadota bacterium]